LSKVPGIKHSFGCRAEPAPLAQIPDWPAAKPTWSQVHGVACAEVSARGQACGEADALFTFQRGVPVAATHADCVPILLARRDGKAVAAVHAGWRGTKARILRALWRALSARGENPAEWAAAVGPAIGPCCYEVSPELASDFALEFAAHGEGLAVPRPRMLDLPAVNSAELRALGLAEVDLLRACTRCAVDAAGEPLFHSYRREVKAVKQYSAIMKLS
jgi:YfiH family protein